MSGWAIWLFFGLLYTTPPLIILSFRWTRMSVAGACSICSTLRNVTIIGIFLVFALGVVVIFQMPLRQPDSIFQ